MHMSVLFVFVKRTSICVCQGIVDLPKRSTPGVEFCFGLSLHIFIMVRHCLWKMCATPGACINETGFLFSLAAVVPQSKSTELCSSSAAVVPHKVNLPRCVVTQWPLCHKVSLPRCEAWRRRTQGDVTILWSPGVDYQWDKGHSIFEVQRNGMGYQTILRTLKILIVLGGDF